MNIVITVPDFGPALYQAIATKLNRAFQASLKGIQQGVGDVIEAALRRSPEYRSLLGGRLWHELGVIAPAIVLDVIVSTLKKDVFVELSLLKVVGSRFDGGLTIGILRADYQSILQLPVSQFQSEGGHTIDWLRWLLTTGPYLINSQYRFVSGPNKASRTGSGVMVQGGSWGVPAEFAGTYRDNWLTRALGEIEDPVSNVIEQELKRHLR